jgi:hypothetical protein
LLKLRFWERFETQMLLLEIKPIVYFRSRLDSLTTILGTRRIVFGFEKKANSDRTNPKVQQWEQLMGKPAGALSCSKRQQIDANGAYFPAGEFHPRQVTAHLAESTGHQGFSPKSRRGTVRCVFAKVR